MLSLFCRNAVTYLEKMADIYLSTAAKHFQPTKQQDNKPTKPQDKEHSKTKKNNMPNETQNNEPVKAKNNETQKKESNKPQEKESDKRQKKGKKYHRCIAALICHPTGKDPYVAVLCTGTKMNDGECYSTISKCSKDCSTVLNTEAKKSDGDTGTKKSHGGSKNCSYTCEGHAEGLCYEVAPIYFQQEMQNCLCKRESVFEFDDKVFSLKSDIKFHLLITEPPCGWIQDQKNPCMEWKVGFEGAPHIPTCSSKILIGSKMGIQGYVSHLLKDRIFIQSVIILCEKNAKDQKTDFINPKFKLPTFCTLKYDSKIFNPYSSQPTFKPLHLVKVPAYTPHTTECRYDIDNHNDDHNNDDKISTCCAAVDQSISRKPIRNWSYNPRTGSVSYDDNPSNSKLSVSKREIDADLSSKVDTEFQKKQKNKMQEEYTDLKTLLNLRVALKELKTSLKTYKTAKENDLKEMTKPVADMLDKITQSLICGKYKSPEEWKDSLDNNLEKEMKKFYCRGKNLIDVQNWISSIEKILEDSSKIIVDCSWKRYFDEPILS